MSRRITKEKPEGYVFGRPTLYKDKYVQMMEDYFNRKPYTIKHTKKGMIRVPCSFPTLDGFAAMIGVDHDTVVNWAKATNKDGTLKYPDFFGAYMRSKDCQEAILIVNGLYGLYKGSYAIHTAKNVLGWRNNPKTKHTDDGDKPNETESLSDEELRERIISLLGRDPTLGDEDNQALK